MSGLRGSGMASVGCTGWGSASEFEAGGLATHARQAMIGGHHA